MDINKLRKFSYIVHLIYNRIIKYHMFRVKYPILLILSILLVYSCSSDDDGYTPLEIITTADLVQVYQNQTIEIDVLDNDENVPTNGVLTLTDPQHGTVQVLDPNNTPLNPSDDLVLYTPNGIFVGQDTFQYTICNDASNCATETVNVNVLAASPVNFDINNVPYSTLSEYNFFEGNMVNQNPVYGVLPYELISPLFTDYAKKKRFIWMPTGEQANYVSDGEIFDFPVGTIIIKTFYYDNVLPENQTKVLETRLLIKMPTEWIFAEYIWDEEQTEAVYDMNGRNVPIEWLQDGQPRTVNYRIPSQSECLMCHKTVGEAIPIGPKPQNINSIFNYQDGSQNQLSKWEEIGYLHSNYPGSITTTVKWDDPTQPVELRMRSYFDSNCAHCHTAGGHCDYRPIKLAFNESADPVNLGICVEPDEDISFWIDYEPTHIVAPGDINNSVLYHRMNTTEDAIKMPLIGRRLIHDEAISLVIEWINSLENTCE
jgi:uncharacterized repeat protein (TIGR03806 family)